MIEEDLLLNEERLKMVLEGSEQGFWDWNIDTGKVQRNDYWAQMLGYSTIKEFESNTNTWITLIHPDDRSAAWKSINDHLEGHTDCHKMEYRMLTKDGGFKWILDHAKIVQRDSNGRPLRMSGTHIDITERKQAEDKIKAALKEKEVLLQELHHRVKNNLQVISSMLALQASVGSNKETAEALLDSVRRIRVMAKVHENLYRSDDLSHINAHDYLNSIVNDIMGSQLDGTERYIFKDDIEPVILGIDVAIPLGQIISEILSNSLKHAFPNGKFGVINLFLKKTNHEDIELVISDDGVGLPKDFDIAKSKTLGLQLIEALTTMIKGKLTISGTPGTCFRISFKGEPAHSEPKGLGNSK